MGTVTSSLQILAVLGLMCLAALGVGYAVERWRSRR